MILGEALLQVDENDRAEVVFKDCPTCATVLLRIEDCVRKGRLDEARRFGEELTAKWTEKDQTGEFLDMSDPEDWPVSLQPLLKAAVVWLREEYHGKQAAIERHLGSVESLFAGRRPNFYAMKSPPEAIPEIQKQLATADSYERRHLRTALVGALVRTGQYDAAASHCVEDAISPLPWEYTIQPQIQECARYWSIYRRKAETMRFFAAHPEAMAPARQTISRLNIYGPNYAPAPKKGWLAPDEVTAQLTAIGPGVMALVHQALRPNTISGEDRSPFVRVIESVGDEQDVPLLIDTFALLVKDSERERPGRRADGDANDARSEAAIERALRKLTRMTNPGKSREERAQFWFNWWQANAARVVLGDK